MLTALILICAITGAAVSECAHQNARAVIRVPDEFNNPVTCFLHAQAYLAETSIAGSRQRGPGQDHLRAEQSNCGFALGPTAHLLTRDQARRNIAMRS